MVFGHSHEPEIVNLKTELGVHSYGGEAYYLNSGSWVTREVLQGEEGKGMTYVEITNFGASLKRWCGLGLDPVVLGSTEG